MQKFRDKIKHIFRKEVKEPVLLEKEEFKQDMHKAISDQKITLKSFFRKVMEIAGSWGFKITIATILLFFVFYSNDFTSEFLMLGVFIAYGSVLFLLRIDSRYSIGAALALLVAVPIYLINQREAFANHLATLAYFFLVVGVIKQFVEYLRERKQEAIE